MLDDMIKWYIDLDGFTTEQQSLLRVAREALPVISNDKDYDELCQKYFDRMPFCNISIETNTITLGESGTYFIDKIFDYEVDDDTLVVSTFYEHGSVQKQLKGVKNKLLLKSDDDIRGYKIDKIIKEAKKYKKTFVYIIGTQLSTGEITPQSFFAQLKEALVKNNIEHKILIDDVHGMYLVPRDYRIFDYVLYTAHSLVTEYDMGLLISKDGKFGKRAYNWLSNYLERLDIILSKKTKMSLFKNLIIQYLNDILKDSSTFRLYTQTVDHIFAVETTDLYYSQADYEALDNYMIRISEFDMPVNWLRIRFQEFSRLSPEKAVEALHCLVKILKKAMLVKSMRQG